jgi:hypothetical protein
MDVALSLLITPSVGDVRPSGAGVFDPWNDDPVGFRQAR